MITKSKVGLGKNVVATVARHTESGQAAAIQLQTAAEESLRRATRQLDYYSQRMVLVDRITQIDLELLDLDEEYADVRL